MPQNSLDRPDSNLPLLEPHPSSTVQPAQASEAYIAAGLPGSPLERPHRPDVHLRFLIDPQSREVTILLLDRASQKVIRTIPPEEMARLKHGDLSELFPNS